MGVAFIFDSLLIEIVDLVSDVLVGPTERWWEPTLDGDGVAGAAKEVVSASPPPPQPTTTTTQVTALQKWSFNKPQYTHCTTHIQYFRTTFEGNTEVRK